MRPSPGTAIYARQSADQEEGIEQQLVDCRREATRLGLTVVAEYTDNDVSGSKARGLATGYAQMLKAIDDGRVDTVIAARTARLTRRLSDVLELTEHKDRRVRVITVYEGVDTQKDDFSFKLLVLVAEREIAEKEARRKRYATERHLKGHPGPGSPPYGYKWIPAMHRDKADTRWEVIPAEAEVVRSIYEQFLQRVPMYRIAKDLSDKGVPTRNGKPWHPSTLRRILMNPHLAALLPPLSNGQGERKHKNLDIEACTAGAWEPVVTKEELLAARAILTAQKPTHDGTARKWLLGGLAMCYVCGAPVRSARAINHPKVRKSDGGRAPAQWYHSYRCPRGHVHRAGDPIDEYISKLCIARLSQPDARNLLEPAPDVEDPAVLTGLIKNLEQREATLARMITEQGMSYENAKDAMAAIRDEKADLDRRLAEATQTSPLPPSTDARDIETWWEKADLAQRRQIVQTLMTIFIAPVGGGNRIRSLEDIPPTLQLHLFGVNDDGQRSDTVVGYDAENPRLVSFPD